MIVGTIQLLSPGDGSGDGETEPSEGAAVEAPTDRGAVDDLVALFGQCWALSNPAVLRTNRSPRASLMSDRAPDLWMVTVSCVSDALDLRWNDPAAPVDDALAAHKNGERPAADVELAERARVAAHIGLDKRRATCRRF